MTGVRLDGDRATIGAGTRLAEVYGKLFAAGRTIPAGCGPTVGISGLTLGGGLGILGRRYGLTSDSLLAATVVLAYGSVFEADDDLLWMLRGGGSPGVVTSLTFATVPAPDSTGFRLTFPFAGAADLLDAWQHALPGLDDSVAPSLVIVAPAAQVRGFGAAPDSSTVDDLIRRLGQRPSSDERRHGTHLQTKRWLAGPATEPEDPRWQYLHSGFVSSTVPAAALIERLTADPRPGEERELDFSPWGGAYNRVAAGATAFPHRDARFLLKQTATVMPGALPGEWLAESFALARTHSTGGRYPNFPEPDLPPQAYYLVITDRRRAVRAKYDPTSLFEPS